MGTRTAKLASAGPPAGIFTNVYTSPPNITTIVKSALFNNLSGAADTVALASLDAGGHIGAFRSAVTLAGNARDEWNGWVVLGPGDALLAYSLNGTTVFWISGAELLGVA